MATIKIEFKMRLPVLTTDEEVEEWLRYQLHDNGSMQLDNALSEYEIEPVRGSLTWRKQ
jgi:hypothetical protein